MNQTLLKLQCILPFMFFKATLISTIININILYVNNRCNILLIPVFGGQHSYHYHWL